MKHVSLWLTLLMIITPLTGIAADTATPDGTSLLPLSKVVLYSSGVGYFQHDGTVQGQTRLDLRFKTDAVNDLLKSLVVQDFGGGRISTVSFESRDPITKTLQSFGINLTSNPSLGQLLDQVRGERVEVAAPTPVSGTILGVERKEQQIGTGTPPTLTTIEYLNLVTDEGLRSLPLPQIQRVRLLNDRLNRELQQALTVLAAGHDTQRKTVSVSFDGQGTRPARVAYLVETPVWKTSYRLVLNDDGPPLLQGWAIVENTTDDDWSAVRLSLVSGRPISFTMDLYQPLYVRRPVVVPESYASLRPQVYDDIMEGKPASPSRQARGRAMAKTESLGGIAAEAPMAMMESGPAAAPSPQPFDLSQGVTAGAKGTEAGELFQYVMDTPVSIARQTSAMLPIVSEKIEGRKVSIFNPAVHPKHPLNGYRMTNTSGLHLMQGPITVFDGGAYAGDARIEDTAPAQERLISYALDLKTEVEVVPDNSQQELMAVSIRKGLLWTTRKFVEAKTYQVKNRDRKAKTVLLEHPFRADWTLTSPVQSPERTRDVYRFPILVEGGQSATQLVREEHVVQQSVRLTDSGLDQTLVYMQGQQLRPALRDALQKAFTLRDRLSQTAAQRTRLEQRQRDIVQEQARIRENMAKLPQNSELYGRYVKKLDQQETETEKLQREVETLKNTETLQRRELNDYLSALDVE